MHSIYTAHERKHLHLIFDATSPTTFISPTIFTASSPPPFFSSFPCSLLLCSQAESEALSCPKVAISFVTSTSDLALISSTTSRSICSKASPVRAVSELSRSHHTPIHKQTHKHIHTHIYMQTYTYVERRQARTKHGNRNHSPDGRDKR